MEKEKLINLLKKNKCIAMLAPSFVGEFDYPELISLLSSLGFDKVVELTFGAKMINRDYHSILKESKKLMISSVCPGIVEFVKEKYPKYISNLILVDSPVIAMGKICRKIYPKHKTIFISPCYFKKTECENSKYIDYVIDYKELKDFLLDIKIKNRKITFDKFYNDYTKIYPLSGGLSKTANLKNILKKSQVKIIDGIKDVEKFLKKPDKRIKFLDCTFCKGGCLGGPCFSEFNLIQRKKRLLDYLELSKKEDIPECKKGLIKCADGIDFSVKEF
jgi:iron only hydrogenase large subunit-like protein